MAILKAGILVIGDEILSGRTHDTNSNFIAKKLTESGISLEEIKIIHDQKETIILNIREFNKKCLCIARCSRDHAKNVH